MGTEPKKPYDLEERALLFAQEVRSFLKTIPRTVANYEDGRQLIRASASIGANYIEANEGLSKKDFLLKAKISRREAKETRFFLRLLDTGESESAETARGQLVQEAHELLLILNAIVREAAPCPS
jgi:four helix bundle protein